MLTPTASSRASPNRPVDSPTWKSISKPFCGSHRMTSPRTAGLGYFRRVPSGWPRQRNTFVPSSGRSHPMRTPTPISATFSCSMAGPATRLFATRCRSAFVPTTPVLAKTSRSPALPCAEPLRSMADCQNQPGVACSWWVRKHLITHSSMRRHPADRRTQATFITTFITLTCSHAL